MSSRVLKKLHGEKDLASALGIDGMSESDDGGVSPARNAVEKPVNNRFELLNCVEQSLSDTEAKEDDDREVELPREGQERNKLEKQDSTHSTDSLKRKKKKKKKKLKSQKSTEENLDDEEDEVEASIREVNKILGEMVEPATTSDVASHDISAEKAVHEKSILSIDLRNLNPDNEMKKIFGSKIVQSEQVKKRGRGRAHGRTTVLVSPKNRLNLLKSGLSMNLLETKNDVYYFAFEHSKQYQSVQLQFLEAVESFNPDNIVELLNMHPYHIDSLIQFSDVCRMGEDSQMAAELIEKVIYYMECCLHPLFNIALGNSRLDYRRVENRSFYVAIFKHLTYVGQRGCYRTALEFCKFLLSLSAEDDPMGVTLVLDYYALRSSQYEFLIKLYYEWNAERNLDQLPNFAFSVPLAMYLQSSEDEPALLEADIMLQNSLIMFPGILHLLLDKCNVQPDGVVDTHPFFRKTNDPPSLVQLYTLYVSRVHVVWKASSVIFWLEKNVLEVLQRLKNNDPYFTECEEKIKLRYTGTPRNILRHIFLSNIKETNVHLPPEMMQSPIFGFDPLPPTDSISSYAKPTRRPAPSDDRGVLSMFFRSLLPNFNVPRDVAAAEANQEAGAVGGRDDASDLRRSVTSLLDAMRDLISNIHMADVPNEGDVDSDEDREA